MPSGPRLARTDACRSPLGHALGGAAAAWLAGGRLQPGLHATIFLPFSQRTPPPHVTLTRRGLEAITFGTVATLADLDQLVDAHSTYTHSIGAVILVTGLTASLTRGRWPLMAVFVATAWSSHILLDWLGSDTSPSIGIMAASTSPRCFSSMRFAYRRLRD